ncbi:hypothetical protein OnM2_033062 [Erysiphe neolycopersici]|uniref:Uncharacterized protein n=1 Tax=Erysiphe neolycopersici TaxID=212602 RepID=A0A420HYA4_9PEZI|nr:hypothetical protein OnM2_033062 [Erysiphe neolycopersici]
MALVPYTLWPVRVALEMSGDFQQLAMWVNIWHFTWLELVKAIIDVLRRHNCIFSSATSFTILLPYREEAYVNFVWRLRDTFYTLPLDQQIMK